MRPHIDRTSRWAAVLSAFVFCGLVQPAALLGQSTPAVSDKPYIVEWVYRVKWGPKEEFFDIFKKCQLPVLDKEKQLGYVTEYSIYSPQLHTSQDSRWDYRVIIVYKNLGSTGHAEEISNQLFPDQATLRKRRTAPMGTHRSSLGLADCAG